MTFDDPFESADTAQPRARTTMVFGEAVADVWYAVLEKGKGKVLFDPGQHQIDARVTAIKLSIVPLVGTPAKFDTVREMIAESAEWAKIVNPSLKVLGTSLKAVNGRFVQAELVPTGRKYTNKAGEEKEMTTVRFVTVFGSEMECRAASELFFTPGARAAVPVQDPLPAAPQPGAHRATALKFVPGLWKASKGDASKFAELLAKNSVTAVLKPEDEDVVALTIAA